MNMPAPPSPGDATFKTGPIVLPALVIAFIVLGYGYWHAKTHGTLNTSIYDLSDKHAFALLKNAEIVIMDKSGTVLATGRSDARYGSVDLLNPETGSCYESDHQATRPTAGMNAWQTCFQQHATWLMHWVWHARFVDIQVKDCRIRRIPVSIEEYASNWWVWWVPLPHVGGKPYTTFGLKIRVDPVACRVLE